MTIKKKLQQNVLESKRKNSWKAYNYEALPKINLEQAKTFRKITKEEYEKLSQGKPRKF